MSDAAAMIAAPEAQAQDTGPLLPLRIGALTLRLGGATVIDNLDLTLGTTGCTVIMGPNGAGKSLLLKLLHGLLEPTSGRIAWGEYAPAQVTARQALVFQKPVLRRRSVAANLDFARWRRILVHAKDAGRRDALLDHVGLAHKASQPARLLSGGEAQRLALARALATDPEILFLDEPTASLDPASVLKIEDIVIKARAAGVRVIFVTHDIGQARRMADDVVFLNRGRVAEHSPAAAFFAHPSSTAARDYLNGRIVV